MELDFVESFRPPSLGEWLSLPLSFFIMDFFLSVLAREECDPERLDMRCRDPGSNVAPETDDKHKVTAIQ